METTKEKHVTFTPGPWVVKHDKEGLPFIGVASDPWTYSGTVATVEQEKDVRLIASAPEMLEALRVCLTELEDWNRGHEPSEGQELARELLAKVEGSEG